MKVIPIILLAILLTACTGEQTKVTQDQPIKEVTAEPKETVFDIEGFEIIPKDSFSFYGNGYAASMIIVNNTGKDIKVTEKQPIVAGLDGFELNKQNSYLLDGEVLESGERKENELLMLYYNGLDSHKVEWLQPVFEIEVDGQTYTVEGDKMYNALPALAQ